MIDMPCRECTKATGRNQPYCKPDCLRWHWWEVKTRKERNAIEEYKKKEREYTAYICEAIERKK